MSASLNRRLLLTGMAAVGGVSTFAGQAVANGAFSFERLHRGTFNTRRIRYLARMAQTLVVGGEQHPDARFIVTDYVAQPRDPRRPVVFLFNGGPIVASSYLHIGAFGPTRYDPPADPDADVPTPYRLHDNADSLLDVADMVFIDPPETGFSRLVNPSDAIAASSDQADSRMTTAFIRQWLKDNGRESSPKYLVGESYGTLRAAMVAEQMAADLPLEGVALLGQALNMVETTQRRANIISYATNLPALTAIAAYHGLIPHSQDIKARIEEAWTFGMGDYLEALKLGNNLADHERHRVAARLETLTGISMDYYLANRLVISKMAFTRQLMKDKGLIVGVYDGRYKGPALVDGRPAPDPYDKVNAMLPPLLGQQLTSNIGVTRSMEDYRAMAPRVAPWRYQPTGGAGGPFDDYDYDRGIARAVVANDKFRLFLGTGIYDTTTTLGAARYLAQQATYPRERIVLREYEGGHMAYSNPQARKAMANDLRAFVTGAAQ